MNLVQLFRSSKDLKRFIYQRCLDYKIPLLYLSREIGMRYKDFMEQYINVTGVSSIEISEQQVNKLLEILAINVRFLFVVDEDVNMVDVSEELSKKHQKIADKERAKAYEKKRTSSLPGGGDNETE